MSDGRIIRKQSAYSEIPCRMEAGAGALHRSGAANQGKDFLVINPSVQYETKWVSERSVWMLRSVAFSCSSFFYRGGSNYRNSVVSFCNTALLLISDFFSIPLAKQKESLYNMTRRTETVIFHGGATLAFTDYETEQLRKALLKETRHCAVTLGMKKTSVDQLTKAVGIAKGSFYKFYESKEMLFFAVLENIHSELYGVADHALSEANGLPPSERAAKAVLAVCRRLSDTGDMVFIENDAKLLLQRLPENVKNVHYHDDEAHVRQLLEKYGLVPKRGISLAAATVRGLILTVSHKEQIGELYPQVLETLVYGACRELFK